MRNSTHAPEINLKRLYYFTVLAEELHFGRAAARLHLAQPGLSQQIKTLEAELGVRLVERGPRETRLTPAGELLQSEAERLLRDAWDLVEHIHAQADGHTSQLRVAYTRSAAYLGTTEAVQAFRAMHPEVEVQTTVAWTTLNLAMLRAREIDIAFVRPPVQEPDIEVLVLVEEELVLALPADHRLADEQTVAPSDVHDEDVVLWQRELGPGYYDSIVRQIWGDEKPRISLEEPDDEQILAAVAKGIGIGIVELHRALRLRPEAVVLKPFAHPVPTTQLGLAWLKEHSTPTLEAFISACRGMRVPPAES